MELKLTDILHLDYEVEVHDDSFAHEFGIERQYRFEVSEIIIALFVRHPKGGRYWTVLHEPDFPEAVIDLFYKMCEDDYAKGFRYKTGEYEEPKQA